MSVDAIIRLGFTVGTIVFVIILAVLLFRLGVRTRSKENVWPARFYALDVSRGFAAISVVFWHWKHFAYDGSALPKNFVWESQPLYRIFKIFYDEGEKGVEYFFLLSGFIFFWLYRESIEKKITSGRNFFVQRFSRLYPLHFVTLLVVALLQVIYVSREGIPFVYTNNDLYHFILNLGFVSHWGFQSGHSFNGPIWSVSIEILLYIVFFVIAFFRQGNWLYCLFVSILSFSLGLFTGLPIYRGVALFFLGGFVFHLTYLISTKKQRLIAPIYLSTIVLWSAVIINFYLFDLSSVFLEFGVAGTVFLSAFPFYFLFPLTVCSLVLLEINYGSFAKRYSWFGDITYSSYLLHFPLQILIALAVSYGLINSAFYLEPIYLGFFFLVLIPLSYLIYRKFERPLQQYLRNRLLNQ
jgi:peptidoglycan/LPS O-acetylase OafA/YrhL